MTEREQDRLRKARLIQRWRAAGCCIDCGLPVVRFVRCLRCRRKHAVWALAWYHRNRKAA